jgi:putative ABC transport system substrate-binding protein
MKRRNFLSAVAAVAFVRPPSAAFAQRPRRIGYLRLAPSDATQLADFRAGLEETGFAEGRNLVIEYRYAEGDYARLPDLAGDLVRQNVEVIVASGGTEAPRAAMSATSTIPIVGTSVGPAYTPPLVKQFNRPEGNVTGVAILTGELTPKRLQILAELAPGAVIGVLMNPTQTYYNLSREQILKAGQALQVKLVFETVSADGDLDPAFASLAGRHVGAILPEAEPFLGNRWQMLVPLAARHAIPMMQEWREAVMAGGLISYAPSLRWVHRQAGNYTGQILNGAKPADLPVVAPTKIELVINLKTAQALGLTVPRWILARADELIE